ncbi:nuclear transport factor 2 family protein [Polaromonas sp. YR568]|uniref:nuclear transport factor 2 family protein n=1 Tax=Polaromonas sp. YR568 TaxID=1855301 RepID=UPI003137D4DE
MNNRISEIEAAEDGLRAAMLAGDVTILDALIDDSLLFIGPDGSVLSKDGDLNLYRSGEQRILAVEFQDRQIRIREAVASVTVLAFVSGVFKGHAFEGHFRYLRVWQRTSAGWKVVAGTAFAISK